MGGWTEGGKEPLKDGQIREGVIDSQVKKNGKQERAGKLRATQ